MFPFFWPEDEVIISLSLLSTLKKDLFSSHKLQPMDMNKSLRFEGPHIWNSLADGEIRTTETGLEQSEYILMCVRTLDKRYIGRTRRTSKLTLKYTR